MEPSDEASHQPDTVALTVADRPAALRDKSSPSGAPAAGSKPSQASAAATAGTTSKHALHVDEVERARAMGLLIGTLCFTAFAWFFFLGGVPWLNYAAMSAVIVLGTVALYVWRRAEPGDAELPSAADSL